MTKVHWMASVLVLAGGVALLASSLIAVFTWQDVWLVSTAASGALMTVGGGVLMLRDDD